VSGRRDKKKTALVSLEKREGKRKKWYTDSSPKRVGLNAIEERSGMEKTGVLFTWGSGGATGKATDV